MTDYEQLAQAYPASPDLDPITAAGLSGLAIGCDLGDVAASLERLRGLVNGADPLARRVLRNRAVGELRRAKVHDAAGLVDAALGTPAAAAAEAAMQGQALSLPDPEPWPEPVAGAALLEALVEYFATYLVAPAAVHQTLAAFTLCTYTADRAQTVPYLEIQSPTPECGKTLTLELLGAVVRRPWSTMLPSPAVLYRVLEAVHPTLLLDEAQVVHGRGDTADAVRALLLGGYKRGAKVPRCVGDEHEVRMFDVFGPKVFALIGSLPDALATRCIRIPLRRRRTDEPVTPFRIRAVSPVAEQLARQARRWADDYGPDVATVAVMPPAGIANRQAETWEPLLAIGDVAGGPWPARLATAALALRAVSRESHAIRLLGDLRALFAARGTDRLPTKDLLEHLHGLEDRPWSEWGRDHRPLSSRGLAALLEDFGIGPKTIRLPSGTPKGYLADDLSDAWARWLEGGETPPDPRPPAPHPPHRNKPEIPGDSGLFDPPHPTPPVADGKPRNPLPDGHCGGVADGEQGAQGGESPEEAERLGLRGGW